MPSRFIHEPNSIDDIIHLPGASGVGVVDGVPYINTGDGPVEFGAIKLITTILDDTAIKNSPAGAFDGGLPIIIPAIEGKLIVLVSVCAVLDNLAGAYDNVGVGAGMLLCWGVTAGDALVPSQGISTVFDDNSERAMFQMAAQNQWDLESGNVGMPVRLFVQNDNGAPNPIDKLFGAGHPSNTLTFRIAYLAHTV